MTTLSSIRSRLEAAPYTAASAGVLLISAYLCLVNLDYAALWHDEATAAVFSESLLRQGDIVGWDGRNLSGGGNGRTLNADLRDVWPPLMYALNAAGFAVFGVNEIGARIIHAAIGVAALGAFYLLLRQRLENHPRLVFFIFTFAAGSAQLLLYFRQSRYFSVMILLVILIFYLYERYWRSRNPWYIPAIALVAALSFFNHYSGGAATMLSLAAYHLIFRVRETTFREWILFSGAGAVVVALGAGYLYWLGVLGGERGFGFAEFAAQSIPPYSGDLPPIVIFFRKVAIYLRGLFTADWISWLVFLWFVAVIAAAWWIRGREQAPDARLGRRRTRESPDATGVTRRFVGESFPLAEGGKIVLIGALFALFSTILSPQAIWAFPHVDMRYYVGALPLLLAMKGLFVEWAWRRHFIAGAAALAALLFTSVGAAPFNMTMLFSGEKTLGPHLFMFAQEIHRPYRDSTSVVSDYLLENAERDDLVYVEHYGYRDSLMFYTGDHLLFCCVLDEDTPLPKDKIAQLQAPLYIEENIPDWIVHFRHISDEDAQAYPMHSIDARLDVFPYPTQRPELNLHAFTPLEPRTGVTIFRRNQ